HEGGTGGSRTAPTLTIAFVAVATLAFDGCGSGSKATSPASVATGRPIVLITIDTLRADRLGSYGSTRGLTPALDRFAQRVTRFSATCMQERVTLSGTSTKLTGTRLSCL